MSYMDTIRALKPDCVDPAEQDLRSRLMLARDVATANLASLSGHAQQLNLMIVEMASAWVFAPATVEQLSAAREFCLALIRASAHAEAFS